MSGFNKILLIILFALIILVIGEVIFTWRTSKTSQQPNTNQISQIITSPKQNLQLIRAQDKNDVLISSQLMSQYQGTVKLINIQEKDIMRFGVSPIHVHETITLLGTTNNTMTFQFSSSEIQNAKVTKTINGKSENGSMVDLNIGDRIHMKMVTDLTNFNLQDLEINIL